MHSRDTLYFSCRKIICSQTCCSAKYFSDIYIYIIWGIFGPTTDSWDTPHVIFINLDLYWFILTNYCIHITYSSYTHYVFIKTKSRGGIESMWEHRNKAEGVNWKSLLRSQYQMYFHRVWQCDDLISLHVNCLWFASLCTVSVCRRCVSESPEI